MDKDEAQDNNGFKLHGIREVDPDRLALVDFIRGRPPGTIIRYHEIVTFLGKATKDDIRHLLGASTRNMLARDYGVAVETVRLVGWKVLAPSEVPAVIGTHTVSAIHRKSRRAVRLISQTTRGKELSGEAKNELGARLACLGAIQQCSKPKAQERLLTAIKNAGGGMLPLATTLDLFKSK